MGLTNELSCCQGIWIVLFQMGPLMLHVFHLNYFKDVLIFQRLIFLHFTLVFSVTFFMCLSVVSSEKGIWFIVIIIITIVIISVIIITNIVGRDFRLSVLAFATVARKSFKGKFTAKIDFPIGYFRLPLLTLTLEVYNFCKHYLVSIQIYFHQNSTLNYIKKNKNKTKNKTH